jgi:hypothetical protein
MPLVLKDRVKETTTTTSTGSYTLAGAVGGYQAFSVIGNGNTTYYAVTNGTDWEVGIGTYTLSGTVLSRDTILESSNSGNAVNWSAGTKEIFCTYPAERSMYVDGTTITPAISARLGFTNLAQGSALSVLGVTGNATADNASIAAGTDNQVLRRSGTSVAFGAVNLASTDAVTGDLPFSNLAQGSALSVLGVTGNATADNASIAAGTDHQVLRRSGTTVAFGAVNLAQSAAVTGTLAVTNGGTGITSFGSGVATWLGTPSSTNLRSAVTDETGTGSLVFATSPTLVTPVLGTPTSGTLSNCTVDGTDAVGFRNTPINSQSAAYTLVLTDAGKTILHPDSDNNARTFTIPANGSVAYPVGTVITFVNMKNTVTIAITTDTMYLAGPGTTGSRTLAEYGVATAVKLTSTSWLISGNGLT